MLPADRYSEVFEKWRGCPIRLCKAPGNVGDRLIEMGATQLFSAFDMFEASDGTEEVVFWCGGGNMGTFYPGSHRKRTQAAEYAARRGKPFVILPQSWIGPDDIKFDQAFIRESRSRQYCEQGILAPDLALAYVPDFELTHEEPEDEGHFFRTDRERKLPPREKSRDPALLVRGPREYLMLASRYLHIHTDRLHFAIAGMIAGRHVTLYENSYHKNIGMWEAWLADLGCEFWRH